MNSTAAIGYAASILLMISFVMKDLTRLRIINSFACVCFVIYGFMLSIAWPVIISNGFVLGANLWHLFKSRKTGVQSASSN